MSDTFPIANPVYGTRISSETDQIVVSFGDGYEQRLTNSLNPTRLVVNLVFEVNTTNANDAVTFLNDRIKTGKSFEFTLPSETSPRKFVCNRFPRTIPYLNRTRLSCVFREVFEP